MTAKILLVDDNALLRRSVNHQLERKGFQILTAEDGSPALSIARAARLD
jgi:DNA-binding response OmpR family regulator